MSVSRLVVLGLDGATWRLIEPWLADGQLPVLQGLRESGTFGPLRSTLPYFTAPAWISMLTGKNPGQLGVYWFRQPKPGSYDIGSIPLRFETHQPLWTLLNRAGKSCYLINTPTITPNPQNYNGVFIGCPILSGEGDFAYPERVARRLHEAGYERLVPPLKEIGERAYLEQVRELTRKKVEIGLELFQESAWDFFMFTFYYTDQVMHFFWKYMDPTHPDHVPEHEFRDAIQDYFTFVDECLGEFVARLPAGAPLIIVSDHGHGPLWAEVNLNAWLAQQGYLRFRTEKQHTANRRSVRQWMMERSRWTRALWNMTSHAPLIRTVKSAIGGAIPQRPVIADQDIDWSKTQAYNPTGSAIFLNLKGREPAGIVQPGPQYEKIRDELIAGLYELKDPVNGCDMVKQVWKREEIYHGPYLERMPDLVLEFLDDSKYVNFGFDHLGVAEIVRKSTKGLSSEHIRKGLFLLSHGYDLNPGGGYTLDIYDVAPTILHLLDIPVPEDMDGRVAIELFQQSSAIAKRPVRWQPAVDLGETVSSESAAEEDKVIETRLRGLGYIE